MRAEEVAAEGLAHPVTQLRLYEPVFPALVTTCRKRVVVKTGFQRKPLGEFDLHGKVGRGKRSRQQVALHGKGLGMQVCKAGQQQEQGQYVSDTFQRILRITFTTQTA